MSPDLRDEPRDQPDDLSLALSEDMLAAEYVLGTLDADERKHAQEKIASDPEFAALVRGWERRLGELHVLTADMEPPPALWDAIKEKRAEIAPSETVRLPDPTPPSPAPAPPPPPETPPAIRALRARAARWRTVAVFAGSLAAALLAFILLPKWGLLPPALSPKPAAPASRSVAPGSPSRYLAVLERDAVAPAFVLLLDAAARSLTLRRLGAPRELGKSYELWLISPQAAGAPFARARRPGRRDRVERRARRRPRPDRRGELCRLARARGRLAHGGAVERGVFRQADGGGHRVHAGAGGQMKKNAPGEARFWGVGWGGYWLLRVTQRKQLGGGVRYEPLNSTNSVRWYATRYATLRYATGWHLRGVLTPGGTNSGTGELSG